MKGCISKVTVWRRKHDSIHFEREILPVLCAWRRKSQRRLTSGNGMGFSARSEVTVIIPYTIGLSIAPGDLIAIGEHDIEITGISPFRENDVKNALGESIIAISHVSHNLDGRGEHFRVEGV